MAKKKSPKPTGTKPKQVLLDLMSLRRGIPALTTSLGTVHAEAASICLTSQGHKPQIQLKVRRRKVPTFMLDWPVAKGKMKRAYNDDDEATEWGASGIAILFVRESTGLTAIERSKKGTGIDYWLGPPSKKGALPFQNKARLEVSGLRNGTDAQIEARVEKKIEQSKTSDRTRLSAYIVVVEFSGPQLEMVER